MLKKVSHVFRLSVPCLFLLFGLSTWSVVQSAPVGQEELSLLGVWSTLPSENPGVYEAGNVMMAFYPNGGFYESNFERYTIGSYTIKDGIIHTAGTDYFGSGSEPSSNDFPYSINGKDLILTIGGGPWNLHLMAAYENTGHLACPGTVASQLMPSYFGRVTYTDGTATRLRSEPSTESFIVAEIPEGYPFVVTDGPVCAEGYTWWKTWHFDGRVGWMAEGTNENYFIEPTPNMTSLITMTTPLQTSMNIAGVWSGSMESWTFYEDGRAYMYPSYDPSGVGIGTYSINGDQLSIVLNTVSINTKFEMVGDSLTFLTDDVGVNHSYSRVLDLSGGKALPGATYYPPGIYKYAVQIGQALATGEAAQYANKYGDYLINAVFAVWEFDLPGRGAYEVACLGGELKGIIPDDTEDILEIPCTLMEWAVTIREYKVKGFRVVGLDILRKGIAEPEKFIDPWLDDINQFSTTCPLSTWLAEQMGLPPPIGCHT